MREIRISSTELARSIGEILGRVRFGRETFIVERNGKPVARLAPYRREDRTKERRGLRSTLRAWAEAGGRDDALADVLEDAAGADRFPEDPWEGSR